MVSWRWYRVSNVETNIVWLLSPRAACLRNSKRSRHRLRKSVLGYMRVCVSRFLMTKTVFMSTQRSWVQFSRVASKWRGFNIFICADAANRYCFWQRLSLSLSVSLSSYIDFRPLVFVIFCGHCPMGNAKSDWKLVTFDIDLWPWKLFLYFF